MSEHTKLVNDILLRFGSRPGLRLWKVNTGAARTQTGAIVRFGQKGQADIQGIRAPSGQFLAIECKTGNAVQSRDQKAWAGMVEKYGGLYVLARNTEDVQNALD